MKRYISVALLLFIITSCKEDFLVTTPPDALTQDGFYNSAERAEMGVNAIYQAVAEEWDRELLRILDVPSGQVILSNTEPLEYNNFTYHPAIQEILFVWNTLYRGIYRANVVLSEVPNVEMDETLKNRYLGEARFLRALNYFTLTNIFGGVPLVLEPFETTDDVLIARSSKEAIYEIIIKDLEFSINVLPLKSSYANKDLGRATKGAAQSLLGKVYLYDKQYEKAADLFKEVIDSGEYALMDNFAHVWHREFENNSESIFEIQYADIGGGGTSSRNGDFLPAVNGATGAVLATQLAVDAFDANDPRLSFSIFRPGDEYAPHIRDDLSVFNPAWSATGYSVKKGMVPILYVNAGGGNIPLIRYADVLLMYAEAVNELGDQDEARKAVNEVRSRPSVNMPLLTAADTDTKEKMFKAIMDERNVELMFEFHRFTDLRRWGLAKEVLGGSGYQDRHELFPIPQLEMDINSKLVQNPGW